MHIINAIRGIVTSGRGYAITRSYGEFFMLTTKQQDLIYGQCSSYYQHLINEFNYLSTLDCVPLENKDTEEALNSEPLGFDLKNCDLKLKQQLVELTNNLKCLRRSDDRNLLINKIEKNCKTITDEIKKMEQAIDPSSLRDREVKNISLLQSLKVFLKILRDVVNEVNIQDICSELSEDSFIYKTLKDYYQPYQNISKASISCIDKISSIENSEADIEGDDEDQYYDAIEGDQYYDAIEGDDLDQEPSFTPSSFFQPSPWESLCSRLQKLLQRLRILCEFILERLTTAFNATTKPSSP